MATGESYQCPGCELPENEKDAVEGDAFDYYCYNKNCRVLSYDEGDSFDDARRLVNRDKMKKTITELKVYKLGCDESELFYP